MAVTGAVDVITGFLDPVPDIPPITPIGFTVFLLNGQDAKAAKQVEGLFSIGKLFAKSAEGLEYALEAIKTGIEIYQGGKDSGASMPPMLPGGPTQGGGQTPSKLLGGRK